MALCVGLAHLFVASELDFTSRDDTEKIPLAVYSVAGTIVVVLHYAIPTGTQWEHDPSQQTRNDVRLF